MSFAALLAGAAASCGAALGFNSDVCRLYRKIVGGVMNCIGLEWFNAKMNGG